MRSDRNLYHKQLSDCQEEIGNLRRKFRATNHMIEQLKDEISVKDNALVKEHFMHHSVDRERELLKNELTKIRKQIESSENIISNQKMEILKLTRIIEEAETGMHRQGPPTHTIIPHIFPTNLISHQHSHSFPLAYFLERARQHSELASIVSERNLLTNQVLTHPFEVFCFRIKHHFHTPLMSYICCNTTNTIYCSNSITLPM